MALALSASGPSFTRKWTPRARFFADEGETLLDANGAAAIVTWSEGSAPPATLADVGASPQIEQLDLGDPRSGTLSHSGDRRSISGLTLPRSAWNPLVEGNHVYAAVFPQDRIESTAPLVVIDLGAA